MAKKRPGGAARSVDPRRAAETTPRETPVEEAARVAERLATPITTSTRAGLPRREPAAHLVPGAFSGGDEGAVAVRSAEEVRTRLDDYQDGVRRARRAAGD